MHVCVFQIIDVPDLSCWFLAKRANTQEKLVGHHWLFLRLLFSLFEDWCWPSIFAVVMDSSSSGTYSASIYCIIPLWSINWFCNCVYWAWVSWESFCMMSWPFFKPKVRIISRALRSRSVFVTSLCFSRMCMFLAASVAYSLPQL